MLSLIRTTVMAVALTCVAAPVAHAVPITLGEAQAGGSTIIGRFTQENFLTAPDSVAGGVQQSGLISSASASGNATVLGDNATGGEVGAFSHIESVIDENSDFFQTSALGVGLSVVEIVAVGQEAGTTTSINLNTFISGNFSAEGISSTAGGLVEAGVVFFDGLLPTDIDPSSFNHAGGTIVSNGGAVFDPFGLFILGFENTLAFSEGPCDSDAVRYDCNIGFIGTLGGTIDVTVGQTFSLLFQIKTVAFDSHSNGGEVTVEFLNTAVLDLTPVDPSVTLVVLPPASAVPEPGTMSLMLLALSGLGGVARRRRN